MSSGGERRDISHLANDLKISEGPKQPHTSRDVKVPVKMDDRRGRMKRDEHEGSGRVVLRRRTGANGGQGSDGLVLGSNHSSTTMGGWKHHGQIASSRRDQSSREMIPVEHGRVKSLKDKGFGFLECCDRDGDMFFHLTESKENLSVGDEVEFRVENARGNSKKPRAVHLRLLPAGTISFEQPVDGLWEGIVKREPCQPSMGNRTGGRAHGGWGEHSAIGWIGDVKAVVPSEPSTAEQQTTHHQQPTTSPVSDTPAEFHHHGSLSRVSVPVAGERVFIPTEDDNVESSRLIHKDVIDMPETSRSQTIVRMGDLVHFSVFRHRRTHALHARQIHCVQSAREVKLNSVKKEGNKTKEKGIIMKLLPEYGFLRCTTRVKDVYFSVTEVLLDDSNLGEKRKIETDWRRGKGRIECHDEGEEESNSNVSGRNSVVQQSSPTDHATIAGTEAVTNRGTEKGNGNDCNIRCGGSIAPPRLQEGTEAEFWVVTDDTNLRALEIKLLQPGSVKLKEIIHKGVMGVVNRSPIRQKGKWKPGSVVFQHKQAQTLRSDGSINQDVSSSEKQKEMEPIHASLAGGIAVTVTNWGTMSDAETVKLYPGDCIVSDLCIDHRDRRLSAVNVQVIGMAGPRISGTICSIKLDEGIGFISRSQVDEEVYFRLNDVLGGSKVASSLSIFSEVSFSLPDIKGGGHQDRDRLRAVRLEILPRHTILYLEVKDISGIVAFEARVPHGEPATGFIVINEEDMTIKKKLQKNSKGMEQIATAAVERKDRDGDNDDECEEEIHSLPDDVIMQINAIEEASPGTSVLLPVSLTSDQQSAILRTVMEKGSLGYTREGGNKGEYNNNDQLRVWKLSHEAHRQPVTQLLKAEELKAKDEAKQLALLRASEHRFNAKDVESSRCMLVDFQAPLVLGKRWACKGDEVFFDLVYNRLSERFCAMRIRINKRAAQSTEQRGYIESLATEKNHNGYIILPDTFRRASYNVDNVAKQQQQQQQSMTQKITEVEVAVMQDGRGGGIPGGEQITTAGTSENTTSVAETNNTGVAQQEDKDLKDQQKSVKKSTARLSVNALVWEPPLSVGDDVVCKLAQDEAGRMIAIHVCRTGKGSIPHIPLNKLPEKREYGSAKNEISRQHGIIVIPPRKFLMEDPSSGDKHGGDQIQTEASVALVRTEKGNRIVSVSPIRLRSFILEEMGPGEGLEDLARGDIVSFSLTRGKDGRQQVLSKVRIHQRCAVPRVRGMVDHLESEGNSEGNPTHAKILALGGITPSTVHVPLVDVVSTAPLKEGDQVEFLSTAASNTALSHEQLDSMSSSRSRTSTIEVTPSYSQRVGAETAATTVPNDRSRSVSAGKKKRGTSYHQQQQFQQQKEESAVTMMSSHDRVYMGLMLVKDLEDTGVQKRDKSRNATTAVRMICAKGPDGTNGFHPGWCSRYPAVDVAIQQKTTAESRHDDIRNDHIPVVPQEEEEETVIASKNNTEKCLLTAHEEENIVMV